MIHLIDLVNGKIASEMQAYELRKMFADSTTIVTTDFVVSGEEGVPLKAHGQMVGYFYLNGSIPIISIDHHGDDIRMSRRISSTNLALEFVRTWGTVNDAVITHADYDSVVASALLTNRLSLTLSDILGPAAIAADHTGEENVLADTLQAIQDVRDVEFSLACLNTLLQQGEDGLPESARASLMKRRDQRQHLEKLVREDRFQRRTAGVYVAYLDSQVDGELLPALLKDAVVIITISPPKKAGDHSIIKTRLGMAALDGMSLRTFGLPGWGGRWNAGSTGRHGGTPDPEAFITAVCNAVHKHL